MALTGTDTIFSDNFATNGPISSTNWSFNEWTPPNGGGSFYGNTQQRQTLPTASNGTMQLKLDTYNPSDPNHKTFVGSEAISNQTFDLSGGGLAFEATLNYAQAQKGIVGGFFLFAGPPDTHDEIDWEVMSKSNPEVTTNIYHNEPLGAGHAEFKALPDSQLVPHTYRIEWLPGMVRWLVDGVEYRTVTDPQLIPTKAMNLHFNIWGPPSGWAFGDSSLVPATTQGQNQTFEFDVQSVKVEHVTTLAGSSAADNLTGTSASEFIDGGGGNDRLVGGAGDDVIDGGAGTNAAAYSGVAQNFAMAVRAGEQTVSVQDRFGSEGTDTLSHIQQIQFADQAIDATTLVKAANLDAADFVPLIDLYNAYLHRAPDAIGLDYWASRYSDGMSLQDIATSMFSSAEASQLRPAGESFTTIVSNAYNDILSRAPDAPGLAYWVGELQSGHMTLDKFAFAFVQAAKGTTSDAQTLLNKESIGAYYAIEQGLNDTSHATAVLSPPGNPGLGVSDVQAIKGVIDDYAAAAATAGTAEVVVKLVGVHVDDVFGAA